MSSQEIAELREQIAKLETRLETLEKRVESISNYLKRIICVPTKNLRHQIRYY